MPAHAVFINGSSELGSRPARIAHAIGERLDAVDLGVRRFGLSDFESSDLVYARADGRVTQHYVDVVKSASALILSTPVCKATYSGGLKLLVDIIPPDALRGKTVLAVASARVGRHFQSVQRAFDDLYRFFDVGFVIPGVFVLDEQIQLGERGFTCDVNAEAAIDRATTALLSALFTPSMRTPQTEQAGP
jgi:FMN reductase